VKKRIVCTVSNDLSTDQRMQRICTTLSQNGYEVTLIGRHLTHSKPLSPFLFNTKRLQCIAKKGFLFYAALNIRLFFYLLFQPFDLLYTVDLDTMPGGVLAAWLRGKKRIFDAHEYFTEAPEVTNRKTLKAFWAWIERVFLPFYSKAITVSGALAEIFEEKHKIPFALVRNMPNRLDNKNSLAETQISPKILLYQGALNKGRVVAEMLAAMQYLDEMVLYLAGEGDLSGFLKKKAKELNVENKVQFLGNLSPQDLKNITQKAWLGLNLLENNGLSYYYSLANKFFDYVQAQVPSLCIDFPEYQKLNADFEVSVLISDISPLEIAKKIVFLRENEDFYQKLKSNCSQASEVWVWENEEKVLLEVVENCFTT
jgi:glycosyltransferase involved in cell wall biosynthesis